MNLCYPHLLMGPFPINILFCPDRYFAVFISGGNPGQVDSISLLTSFRFTDAAPRIAVYGQNYDGLIFYPPSDFHSWWMKTFLARCPSCTGPRISPCMPRCMGNVAWKHFFPKLLVVPLTSLENKTLLSLIFKNELLLLCFFILFVLVILYLWDMFSIMRSHLSSCILLFGRVDIHKNRF